jgi:DNA-binding HxlR family transcriptional regulator
MEVIGRKWHPVIIHRLLDDGPLRFNELADEVGAVTNKVLTSSLKDLQEKFLVERTLLNDQPVEVEYALTERGQSLEPVIDSLEGWGKAHLQPAESPAQSI